MSWRPMRTAPKTKPCLILLEECAGTYPVLAQWKDTPPFCWHVMGAMGEGKSGWNVKCALGWAPIRLPKVPPGAHRVSQKKRQAP